VKTQKAKGKSKKMGEEHRFQKHLGKSLHFFIGGVTGGHSSGPPENCTTSDQITPAD